MKQSSFIIGFSMFLLVVSALLGLVSSVITGEAVLIAGSLVVLGFFIFLALLILKIQEKKAWPDKFLSYLKLKRL